MQRRRRGQPHVGSDAIAPRDLEQVAGHDLLGEDFEPDAVAAHPRTVGDELRERRDRAPGPGFLREADQRVEDDHRQDDQPVLDLAERERRRGRREQRPRQRRAALVEQEAGRGRPARLRQLVEAEALEPYARVRGAQPTGLGGERQRSSSSGVACQSVLTPARPTARRGGSAW